MVSSGFQGCVRVTGGATKKPLSWNDTRPGAGGDDGNRTHVQGFAGPCLNHSATSPLRFGCPNGGQNVTAQRALSVSIGGHLRSSAVNMEAFGDDLPTLHPERSAATTRSATKCATSRRTPCARSSPPTCQRRTPSSGRVTPPLLPVRPWPTPILSTSRSPSAPEAGLHAPQPLRATPRPLDHRSAAGQLGPRTLVSRRRVSVTSTNAVGAR